MAHFFTPPGAPARDYDVDGRLAPDSIWRVRIPLRESRQVGLWGGRGLWVRSTNETFIPNNGFARSENGDITILTLTALGEGDCRLEVGQGDGTWIILEVETGVTQAATGSLNAATQRGTYENIDAAAVVRHFHQGKSGSELLGGRSRGYMRWLEIVGQDIRDSSGPMPGFKPTTISLPWKTYSDRPKLLVYRQGFAATTANGPERRYLIEVWWLPDNDNEYQVLAGHLTRAEAGDTMSFSLIARPFAGDLILFDIMKREMAIAVAQSGLTLIVSAAVWKAGSRNPTASRPAPPEAVAAVKKGPPTKAGITVLVVGPETEAEFQYAQKVNAGGGSATAVNPIKSPAAAKFEQGGGKFVQGQVGSLPKDQKFDIIREDYPYPTGNYVDKAGAGERISRLKPGGSWVVVTEKADFADTLQAAATMNGAKVFRSNVAQFHEGTPVSNHPKDAGRIAIIITKE